MRLITAVHGHDFFNFGFACVFVQIFGRLAAQHLRVGDVPLGVFQQFFVFKSTFLEGLFDDVAALRFAVNREVGRHPHGRSKITQNADAHAVNGANPHSVDVHHLGQTFLHFVSRLVGEGDGKDCPCRYPHFFNQIGNTGRQNTGFPTACARQNQNRAFCLFDRPDLFTVQFF